jgi:hypothetical protein
VLLVNSQLRIIVTGLIAQYPLGGVTWDYIQYVLGLKRLGHDVYYIEDTGLWPYNPVNGGLAKDCKFNVKYLTGIMSRYSLADNWAYRFPWQSQWFGMKESKRLEVIKSADLLINISGSLEKPQKYRQVSHLAFIDSDPMFTQIKLAEGNTYFREQVDMHDIQFTFGECLSAKVPETGHQWHPTRQPILLSEWVSYKTQRNVFTTVMNWTSYKDLKYKDQTYGQKDVEFLRFLELPSKVSPIILEVATNVGKTRHTPFELLSHKGWRVVDPLEVVPDLDSYRLYIGCSKAEWSIAKNGYVQGQTGWFSCRSACYLAAGRPVVVQDTGFSSILPVSEGILTFRTIDEAANAIHEVETDYERHANAAREIAEEYFDSDKVLTQMIDTTASS